MRATLLLLALPLLGACELPVTDPFRREGAWRPTHANDANLAAQVRNPAHLREGVPAFGGSDGQVAAAAVARWRSGRVTPLPASGIAKIEATGTVAPTASGPSGEALTGAR